MDVYEGEMVNMLRHGDGTMHYAATGDKYEGEWIKDVFDGFGVYTWSISVELDDNNEQIMIVGKRYEGDYKEGKKEGKGLFFLGTGDVYSGCFSQDCFHGNGTLKKENGDIITGEWQRGRSEGKVEITYTSAGESFVGDMVAGEFYGKGKFQYSKKKGGGYYDGNWVKGKKHGSGVRIYADGSKFVGNFFENEIHGDGMKFFPNGNQYLG